MDLMKIGIEICKSQHALEDLYVLEWPVWVGYEERDPIQEVPEKPTAGRFKFPESYRTAARHTPRNSHPGDPGEP